MILLIPSLCKIVCVLIIGILCYWKLHQYHGFAEERKYAVLAEIVIVLVSYFLSSFINPISENVTLTAMGEDSRPGTDEVCLIGYTIDGEDYIAGKSLDIVEGKWFWAGENYCWRSEQDSRQPQGVTKSVKIQIPVGIERSLNFSASKWRGQVQISTQSDTWVVDTYMDSEDSTTISAPLGQSTTSLLFLNGLYSIGAFLFILVLLSGITLWIFQYRYEHQEEWKCWIDAHLGKVFYAGLAIWTFAIMMHYAATDSFWIDELLSVNIIQSNWQNVIDTTLQMREATPPLYDLVGVLWARIAPYGEQWLLLLSIIPSVISIYVIGLIGEKLKGRLCGVIASVIAASSTTVWVNIAYELRAYAFVLLFAALTFYFYIQRDILCTWKKLALFSLSLACLEMSHYFGMMICCLYFASDIYLFIRKRIKWTNLTSYIFPCIIGFLWILSVYNRTLSVKTPEQIASWYPVPTLSHIQSLLQFLTGESNLVYCLLLLSIGYSIILWFARRNTAKCKSLYFFLFSNACIIATLSILYCYGNFVNQKSTMWQGRYFLVLLPFVCVCVAVCAAHIVAALAKTSITKGSICLSIYLLLSLNCISYAETFSIGQPYREAADWIYTQANYIYNNDTAILIPVREEGAQGFNQYYLARNGRREQLNALSQESLLENIDVQTLLKYTRIYIVNINQKIAPNIQQVLSDNYTVVSNQQKIGISVYEKNE